MDLFESDLAKCKNSYPARKNIFGRHYMYTYMADHYHQWGLPWCWKLNCVRVKHVWSTDVIWCCSLFGTKTYHYVTVPTGLMLRELQTHIISKKSQNLRALLQSRTRKHLWVLTFHPYMARHGWNHDRSQLRWNWVPATVSVVHRRACQSPDQNWEAETKQHFSRREHSGKDQVTYRMWPSAEAAQLGLIDFMIPSGCLTCCLNSCVLIGCGWIRINI